MGDFFTLIRLAFGQPPSPVRGKAGHWQLLDCGVVSVDEAKSLPPGGGRWRRRRR